MQTLATVIADFETQLSTKIDIGDTTATLSSATDDDGVALPSGKYFFTVDNSNSQKEHFVCDLVGTALTNLKSVSRQGVQTTGAVRTHRVGATVSITDFAHLQVINDLLNGTTGFDANTNLGYDGAPTGLTGNQFATVAYVLSVVSGGTVSFDVQTIPNQTAGESVTIRNVGYFKESDQRWYNADADLTATFDQLQIGIIQTTATVGNSIQVAISGLVGGFTGLTAGAKYYLSNTAGGITTTPGTNSVFIGWALSTTQLLFSPYLKTLPTQNEKDAMAGTAGTPSTSNKYITEYGISTGGADQSQTTRNAGTVVGAANTTTNRNKIAESFTAAYPSVRGVSLYKDADTGSFTGTVTISIQSDTAGSPSGSSLATVTLSNAAWLAIGVGKFTALFAAEYTTLAIGTLYWIVVQTSTSDTSNHPNLGTNSAGGYAGGSLKYNNTTDGWVAVATIDLYFETLKGTVGKVAQLNSSGVLDNSIIPLKIFTHVASVGDGAATATTTITHNLGKIPSFVSARAQGAGTAATALIREFHHSQGSAFISSAYGITYTAFTGFYSYGGGGPGDISFQLTTTAGLLRIYRDESQANYVTFTISNVTTTTMDITMTKTLTGSEKFQYILDIHA